LTGFDLTYPTPDHVGDLRDDGVAEASQSVHPSGNPMSHSTHVGFSCPPAAVCKLSPPSRPCRPGPVAAFACGVGTVGDDKDAITAVRGANGGSGYTVPPRIVPERGQVPEYRSKSPSIVN